MRNLCKNVERRVVAFALSLIMVLSLMVISPNSVIVAEAATDTELPTIGARSESNGYGDVFLGGNYIEVGISKHGSFGTSSRPTGAGWHPHQSAGGLGLTSDGDGWNVGEQPLTGDFFLPGSPEECWGFSYYCGGTKYEYFIRDRNNSMTGSWKVQPSVKDESDVSKGELKAVVTGVTTHNVEIKITYSFGVDDKFYNTTVEVNNNSGKEISNVRFIRSFDPDQDQQTQGDFYTYNKVICNPVSSVEGGGENFAMVVARGYKTMAGFFFVAFDNRARVSRGVSFAPSTAYSSGFWDTAPVTTYTYAETSEMELTNAMVNSGNKNGYTYEDDAIAITFNLGNMANGTSDEFTFASSLDPDVNASLEAVKKAAGITVNSEYGRLEGFVGGYTYEVTTYDPEDTEKENPIGSWKVEVEMDGSYTVKDLDGNVVEEGLDAINVGVYFLSEWYGYNILVIKKGLDDEEDAESDLEAVNPEQNVVPSAPSEESKTPIIEGQVTALLLTNLKSNQQYRLYDYNGKMIKDWFAPTSDQVTNGYRYEPIACGCDDETLHTHPYYVSTRYSGDDNDLPSDSSDKIISSPEVTIPAVDSEVDLAEGCVEIIADGLYQQTLEDGTVVRFRYGEALKVVQSNADTVATDNTIRSMADNADIILAGVNINITDDTTVPIVASGAMKVTIDGSNRIGASADNAISAKALEFTYAGSTDDALSMDAEVQSIVADEMKPEYVKGFDGKTSAEFENTDGNTTIDDNEFVAINRPQIVYVGGEMIVQNGMIVESALEKFGDTVKYDSKTATLTLDGAELTGTYSQSAIYANGDLRINVKNDSSINIATTYNTIYGAQVTGEVTVIGDGTLDMNIAGSTSASYKSYGIYGNKSVNIKSDVDMNITGAYAIGVYSQYGDVSADGGDLSIKAPNASYGYGLWASSGDVNATDATLDIEFASTSSNTYGVYVSSSDKDINLTNTTAKITANYGIYSKYDSVNLEGGDVDVNSAGYGIYANSGSLNIDGTDLDITARPSDASTSGYGIYTANLDVDDGDINIKAGSVGIYTTTTMDISGGTMDVSSNSYGIYNTNTKMNISDGKVSIDAKSYGIYNSYSSSSLAVSGGNVYVQGGTSAISASSQIDVSSYTDVIVKTGNTEDSMTTVNPTTSRWHNYKKIVSIGDGLQDMEGVSADDVNKKYDGVPVGISVLGAPEGAVIKYGDSAGNYTLTESPTYTDVSNTPYTVYYEVTCDGYKPYIGSATITIQPRELVISATAQNASVSANPHMGYVADSVTAKYTIDDVEHRFDVNELTYSYFKSDDTSLTGAPTEIGRYKLVISTENPNFTGSATIYFEIKDTISLSGDILWNYAYSYSDDHGNVQSGVVDDIATQRSKKAVIKLYNNGVLVEGFEYLVDAVAGADNTASGSYAISGLPSVVNGVDANYTVVIVPLVYVSEDGTEVKEAESYYVTMSGSTGYINYIPECFDATWTVTVDRIVSVDEMIPTELYVKVLYAVQKDGSYKEITQMSDSSALCVLTPNVDGTYTATGKYPVWKTQTDGTTYYHRVQVVGYKVNGVYIDTTQLGLISNDENIMYYDIANGEASRNMELTLAEVQIPIVEFDADGGTVEHPYILMDSIGSKLLLDTINANVATKTGCIFDGWTLNDNVVADDLIVNGKVVLKVAWKDLTSPEILGIEDGKTYCENKTITIVEDNLEKVTVNGSEVTLTDNTYELLGTGTEYTVLATDKAGNSTLITVIVFGSHDMSKATCTEASKCQREDCDYTEGTALGHDMSEATCTEASKCQREECDYTEGTALGHDWTGEWKIIKEATATEEGKKETFCVHGCGQKKIVIIPPTGTTDDNGNLEKYAEVKSDAPIDETTFHNSKDELLEADNIFTAEEKMQIENGTDARVWIEISKTDESAIAATDKANIEQKAAQIMGDNLIFTYFDVNMFKQVGNGAKQEITEPGIAMKITIKIPDELLNSDKTVAREYKIIRLHEGQVDVINGSFDVTTGEFTFESDKFSTYAIVYKDVPVNDTDDTQTPGDDDTQTPGDTDDTQTSEDTDNNSKPGDTDNTPEPEDDKKDEVASTGDSDTILYAFVLMLLGGLGIIFCSRNKKILNKES